ncbi:RNA-directed DNA polymerase, eukaryota, Reverse transcriptase zinc-binding domain protein [Artemisia annua]|uniref:RNA-directed DNA polymerase, eukaryota, Reverse transcriptase zinc-binding domain protein n=1 Tax=Artemisia annua TaxID=35608 RepID=A0A2U1LH36_ARTAN|nr:RNA-directed DNA polymerase, eukaryota, Reverse transcriptase zinc-binding domain protein [Artemisia annua]
MNTSSSNVNVPTVSNKRDKSNTSNVVLTSIVGGPNVQDDIVSKNQFDLLSNEYDTAGDSTKDVHDADSDEEGDIEQVYDELLHTWRLLLKHVDVSGVYDMCRKVCMRWKWTLNRSLCDKGSRIILGWNNDLIDVTVLSQTNQVMHAQVNVKVHNKVLFCSFRYADNYYIDFRALWTNLDVHNLLMRAKSWILLGDLMHR